MRVVPARPRKQPAAPAGESERLLRLLEDEGFGIARRSYAPREAIEEEDQATSLHVLTSGTAFLLRSTPLSGEVALGLLKGGDAFGNLAFAGGIVRGALVRALTACEVAKVPGPTLEATVRRNPLVATKLMTLQEARLTRYEEFVARIWSRKTLIRLAGTLLFLSEHFPERNSCGAGPVAIGVLLTHEDLAAMVVSSRESVGAAMVEMRRWGIVDVRDGIVTVQAPEKLREASMGRRDRTSSITPRRTSPVRTVVSP